MDGGRRGSSGPANAATRGPNNNNFQSSTHGPGNLASIDWVIGTRVKVQTIHDDTIEGTIYSYDTKMNCISLITSPPPTTSPPPKNFPQSCRILKIPFLKDVTFVAAAKPVTQNSSTPTKGPFSAAEPAIKPLSLQSLRSREQAALRAEYEKSLGHGVNVTKEGQEIYDALSKTMPCRWQGKDIVVLDMILIQEPYTTDSCSAPEQQAGAPKQQVSALNRVKKVLEGERKRLETVRRSNASTPNPTTTDRKGG